MFLAPGTSLVPDVAFFSDDRLAPLSEDQRAKPPFAPDIVVEVRSPDDREVGIRRKTALYLEHGAMLVLNADLSGRTVRLNAIDGERLLRTGDTIEHPAFPDLHVPVASIFAPLDRGWSKTS